MRKFTNSTGLAAAMAFFVWFTIVFARTHAFTELLHDGTRSFAILGTFVSLSIFGACIYQIFFEDHGDPDDE